MKDVLEILLDEENKDPIVLTGNDGRSIAFEQIAIIPYDAGQGTVVYAVLKPIDKIDKVADDEAIVFKVEEDGQGNSYLTVEQDEGTAVRIFEEYYDLLAKEWGGDPESAVEDVAEEKTGFAAMIEAFARSRKTKNEEEEN